LLLSSLFRRSGPSTHLDGPFVFLFREPIDVYCVASSIFAFARTGTVRLTFFPAYLPRVMMATRPTLRTIQNKISDRFRSIRDNISIATHTSCRLSFGVELIVDSYTPRQNVHSPPNFEDSLVRLRAKRAARAHKPYECGRNKCLAR
jgi:hypothetical protein